MKNKISILSIAILAGCSTLTVKKDKVKSVKKVAIISIFTNPGINNHNPNGGWQPYYNTTHHKYFNIPELLQYSNDQFIKTMSESTGWKIISYDEIMKKTAFKKFKINLKKYYQKKGSTFLRNFCGKKLTYKNSPTIVDAAEDKRLTSLLVKLTRELNVDAVMITTFNFGHVAGGIAIFGSVSFDIRAGFQVIDKNGDFVIKTPLCGATGIQGLSSSSMPVVLNSFKLDKKTRSSFLSAIDNTMIIIKKEINKQLK